METRICLGKESLPSLQSAPAQGQGVEKNRSCDRSALIMFSEVLEENAGHNAPGAKDLSNLLTAPDFLRGESGPETI